MKENFKRKILSNGLTVLFEKRDIPVVSMSIGVRAGGINESEEDKGISHFIEHMLYKGTASRTSKKIAEDIEKNGGELNGFTSEELTAFYCKMPSKHADIGLDVLADMVKNSLFLEEEMEKERKVIFEEIKMRKDNPQVHVLDSIHGFLYEPPFGIPLIGTYDTMNSIDREKILKRFKETYFTSNMILCVVGNYDFDKLIDFAEKNFEKKDGNVSTFDIVKKNEIKLEERQGVDQVNLIFAFHSPLDNDEKIYSAEVLMALMAEGMSSRLFTEIREKRNLAYGVKGHLSSSKDYSYSFVYVGTTKDKMEEVKKLILEEFRKVSESLDEEELAQIKEQLIGNHQISMEDSQSQMVNLLSSEVSGDVYRFYNFEESISKVNLEDVKELASKVKEGSYSFFALVPKD